MFRKSPVQPSAVCDDHSAASHEFFSALMFFGYFAHIEVASGFTYDQMTDLF